jgi:PIN domain nuclease of toxin-antitoxin system
LAISAITLLELAALRSKNRISFGMSLESFLGEVEKRFVILPLTSRVCARAVEFTAMIPRDPADRIILATAMTEGIPLLTADRAIRQFSVARTIW